MLTWYLIKKNGIKEWITRAICYYAEAKNKYSSDFDEKKKLHTFSILILTINTDGIFHNHFLMTYLIMFKIYQSLCMILLQNIAKTEILVIH